MYVSEQEVRAVLTYQALIPAIRQALIDYSAGRVEQPARTILRAGNADDYRNGWFAVMPVIAGDVMAVKTVTFFPGNDALGLPTHMAVIELLRRATGEPLADLMAVKTVTFFPGNDALGLPTHMAVIELLRRATGEPLAVMDGRLITEMRTAAVSAVALYALGSAQVRSLGILGSGVQARAHIKALRMVRPSL